MLFIFGKGRRSKVSFSRGNKALVAEFEPGVEVEGKIRIISGAVRINTRFKGELAGEGTVVIADKGEVEADLNVRAVFISGKLRGAVTTSDRIEIISKGVVMGEINTPILVVEPGGLFDGDCHMPAPGAPPTPTTSNSSN